MTQSTQATARSSRIPTQQACDSCMVAELCMSRGLPAEDRAAFRDAVSGSRIVRRGEVVSSQGDPLVNLLVVRSGSVKRVMDTQSGDHNILSFQLPGQVIGFDALASGVHPASTVALETSSLCVVPLAALERLATRNARIQSRMLQAASQSILDGHERARLLAQRSAEQRLGSFLIMLSRNQATRRLSPFEFQLPMARQDIANYLCLAFETVSRVLSGFNADGVLAVRNRAISIIDPQRLAELADDPAFLDLVPNRVANG